MAHDHPLAVQEHQDHFIRIQVKPSSLGLLVLKAPREMVVDRVVVYGATVTSSAIKLSSDVDFVQDSGSTFLVGTNAAGVNAAAAGDSLTVTNNVVPKDHHLVITGGGSVTCEVWLRSRRK